MKPPFAYYGAKSTLAPTLAQVLWSNRQLGEPDLFSLDGPAA
jgi:hypothetical protein